MNADEPGMDWWEGLVDNNGITIEISPKNLKKINNINSKYHIHVRDHWKLTYNNCVYYRK